MVFPGLTGVNAHEGEGAHVIFGSPISWVVTEALALLLFFVVVVHAAHEEKPARSLLEVFAFLVAAAIFENVGVNLSHNYSYDLRRVMMIGSVPLEILMIEAVIWYGAFRLTFRLGLPHWAKPFVVGLLGSVQDLTIDPVAVFDRHALTDSAQIERWSSLYPGSMGPGGLSGQWNWTNPGYDDLLFGIPFYNFSGWYTLMAYFTVCVLIAQWVSGWAWRRFGSALPGYLATAVVPFGTVALISSPLNLFLLFGAPFFAHGDRTVEIAMLTLNYGVAIVLLAWFHRRYRGVDLQRDGLVIFGIPVALHLFDIVYALTLGVRIAYAPVLVVSLIHFVYLASLLRRSRSMKTRGESLAPLRG